MLPSSPPGLLRQPQWILSHALCSRRRIEPWRMVSASLWSLSTGLWCVFLAGIPYEKAAGSKTCVFTGISADDYRLMYYKDVDRPIQYAATGMTISMLANKISWFYDFRGPSVQLDTACSASLNALHLACRSLRLGESDMVRCPTRLSPVEDHLLKCAGSCRRSKPLFLTREYVTIGTSQLFLP